jgi:hypothetical protein
LEPAVDPGDDERHVKRQRKNEKPDRVEERLVANLSDVGFSISSIGTIIARS